MYLNKCNAIYTWALYVIYLIYLNLDLKLNLFIFFIAAALIDAQYQIFFMKKLWVNTIPGKDENADEIFYYHQELPKYLRGYHKCTTADAVTLAAYIYRAKFEDDISFLQTDSRMVKDFVPQYLFKSQSSSAWKKSVIAAYNLNNSMSASDAKANFLKHIYPWPTFGSAFFEVKQTTEPKYPEYIVIAINKNGVNIIHPITRVSLVYCMQFFDYDNLFSVFRK